MGKREKGKTVVDNTTQIRYSVIVMNKQQVIDKIRQMQGGLNQKEYAESLDISPQYLCDIYKGRRDPGPRILKAVGIKDKGKVYE